MALINSKLAVTIVMVIGVTGLFLTLLASGVLISTKTITSSGTVVSVNVGIYLDNACQQPVTSLNWGSISPRSSATLVVYVKNTGTTLITLSMMKTNWNPASANGPITVTWNREGATLTANQVAAATLTLSVSPSISGVTTFSFDVIITGTG